MPRDVLLVTGASSDLGLALIRRLVCVTEAPLVIAHAHAGLERVEMLRRAPDVVAFGDHIHPIAADLSNAESVVDLAARIEAEHGTPAQLVHLPGLPLVYERFSKFNWEHFARDLDIQLKAAVLLLQRFAPKMAKMPRAKVVFVLSSVTRGLPPKFLSMYTVVKHAQLGLMKALAAEYAGTALTVNAVSPSMIETRFLEKLPEVAVRMAASSSPHGRNASPEDVIGAITFLLSKDSDYMTGVELPITAGSTC